MTQHRGPGLVTTIDAIASLLRMLLIAGAAVLLSSLAGAAVIAAPVTLPLLVLIVLTSYRRVWRVAATTVAALTVLEAAWTITWELWKHPIGSLAPAAASAALFYFGIARLAETTHRA
jgi:hypothetical protein